MYINNEVFDQSESAHNIWTRIAIRHRSQVSISYLKECSEGWHPLIEHLGIALRTAWFVKTLNTRLPKKYEEWVSH